MILRCCVLRENSDLDQTGFFGSLPFSGGRDLVHSMPGYGILHHSRAVWRAGCRRMCDEKRRILYAGAGDL